MKIYYKDILTGKIRWTNPKNYEIKEVNWLGGMVRAIIAYRKSDCLIIPPWALAPQSKHLLAQEKGA
jgi:hypothetical protein